MAEFSISGMPENSKIPEDESEKKPKKESGITPRDKKELAEIASKFGLTPQDLTEIMDTFKEIVARDLDPEFIESLGEHFRKEGEGRFGVDLEGVEMVIKYLTDETNPKLDEIFEALEEDKDDDITQLLGTAGAGAKKEELFKLLDQIMEGTSEGFFQKLAGAMQGMTGQSPQKSSNLLDALKDKETKIEERKNPLQSFDILADNESFGVIPYTPADSDQELYDLFVSIYGEGPKYHGGIFSGSTKGYNLIPALGNIREYQYIMSSKKYILLVAFPNELGHEPFMVAAIQNEPSIFELVVPEYGNTYNFETGEPFNTLDDRDLYIEKENPEDLDNPILNLKQPIDVDKIRAGLDSVLYEPKTPILNAASFGEILVSFSPVPFTTQYIKVGRIKSNESSEARIFKRDFGVNDDKILFDFYIKLPAEESAQSITGLQKFLEAIDFNTNPKIQCQELRFDPNGNLYINLDLGDVLPGNIRKWIKE